MHFAAPAYSTTRLPRAAGWSPEGGGGQRVGRERERDPQQQGTISGNFGKRVRLYTGGPSSRRTCTWWRRGATTKSYLPLIHEGQRQQLPWNIRNDRIARARMHARTHAHPGFHQFSERCRIILWLSVVVSPGSRVVFYRRLRVYSAKKKERDQVEIICFFHIKPLLSLSEIL